MEKCSFCHKEICSGSAKKNWDCLSTRLLLSCQFSLKDNHLQMEVAQFYLLSKDIYSEYQTLTSYDSVRKCHWAIQEGSLPIYMYINSAVRYTVEP